MTEQRRRGKYPDEMRESAVRMVFEAQRHCGSQWEAISSVAEKLGRRPRRCASGCAAQRSMRAAGLVVVAAGAPGVAPPVGDADGEADRRLLGRAARGEHAEVDDRDVQERAADIHPHGVGVVEPAGAGQDRVSFPPLGCHVAYAACSSWFTVRWSASHSVGVASLRVDWRRWVL